MARAYLMRRTGRYDAWVTLENPTKKTIASVKLDYVFYESATGLEFLRYHLQLDRRIAPGRRKEFRHEVGKGRRAAGFSPAVPDAATLERTSGCGLARDIRPGVPPPGSAPCVFRPEITRVVYTDGSVWQPGG